MNLLSIGVRIQLSEHRNQDQVGSGSTKSWLLISKRCNIVIKCKESVDYRYSLLRLFTGFCKAVIKDWQLNF
jgi:hypothetical protein